MASGIKDKVVIAGMGCSRFGERWSCGPRRSHDRGVRGGARGLGGGTGSNRGRLARRILRRAERRQIIAPDVHGAASAQRADHPGRKSLRHGHRGAPRRGLRRGGRRLRHRSCHGRREAQGHGLRRTARTHQGHLRGSVSSVEHRARRLRPAGERLRQASTVIRCRSSSAPWRTSPARATRMRRATRKRICATASPSNRCSMHRSSPIRSECSTAAG